MSKAKLLRQALSGDKPVVAIGGHDGLSAKLAERAGFDAVWASGLEISTSAGVPDANILTMTDFLRAAREMNSATSLPIVADCDTGFGNSNNVIHMVRQYETSGIAAVCIEDKLFPKVNSFVPGRQELATAWEFAGKIMAAKHAQELPDLVVIARLESLIAGHSVDEALRRADTYHRAGADMILIHSKSTNPDQILGFLRLWGRRCPVAIVPTTFPQLTVDDWQREGVNLIIYANQGMRAAITAVEETYAKIISARCTMPVEEGIAPLSTVFDLQGMPEMKVDEARFLTNVSGNDVRAVIPAGGTLSPGDLDEKLGEIIQRPLLDIYGRTILQRQYEVLSLAGVKQVTLVSDIPAEMVQAQGPIEAVPVPGGGLMSTIMAGLRQESSLQRSLICYSDLLFDLPIVEKFLEDTDDIVIMVDRTFRASQDPRKGTVDLVVTDPAPPSDLRVLKSSTVYRVTSIGKQLPLQDGHFEFVGLLLLSAKGGREFQAAYEEYPNSSELSLTDFLQRLVDDGVTVKAHEVSRGWLEVHDFEDYKRAVEQVTSR